MYKIQAARSDAIFSLLLNWVGLSLIMLLVLEIRCLPRVTKLIELDTASGARVSVNLMLIRQCLLRFAEVSLGLLTGL